MNHIINSRLIAAALLAAAVAAPAAVAQDAEPIITFHTNLYELQGASNTFTFYLGARETTYVDVDCGFGSFETEVEGAVFDADNGKVQGTGITCTVNSDGIVRVYGDPSLIDFVDMEGCYISDISWPQMTSVEILNLNHNELTGLDLTHMTALQAAYLDDNPFSEATPLVIGAPKPQLTILEMSMTGWVDPAFNLSDYPSLMAFTAYSSPTLANADTSGCPELLQLSIDGSRVSKVDVSKNPKLLILNVSETRVTELDLSHNPYLTELYCQHEAATNQQYKIRSLDLSHNPEIQRLYVNGNLLESLDLSTMPKLTSFSCKRNLIKELSFDANPVITLIDISLNYMNYNTMPAPRTTFSDYVYNQYPMAMPRSCAAGSKLDFAAAVMRPGSVTDAVLYSTDPRGDAPDTILGEDYWTWGDDGTMTLLKPCADSVYVAFKNTLFPDYVLRTTAFMVKDAAEVGKPVAAATMKLSVLATTPEFSVGIAGASPESPVEFTVDFGDGNPVAFTATSETLPGQPNVKGAKKGQELTVYVPEGSDLTALGVDGLRLYSLDVSASPALAHLSAAGCLLPSVDLLWNSSLRYVDLSGNMLKALDLGEGNQNYLKTRLSYIDVSDNALTSMDYNLSFHPAVLKAARNKLTTLDLSHASGIQYIDFSSNRVSEVSLIDCESLGYLNLAGNLLTALEVPAYTPLETLDISDNRFSLATLPVPGAVPVYSYAPQAPLTLPTKAPSVNLSDQSVEIDGAVTSFAWFTAEGDAPVAGGDIVETRPGRFRFANPDAGEVYCVLSHPAWPELSGDKALRTTAVLTAGVPTVAIAEMLPSADAEGTLVLAAPADGMTVYADFTGDGDLEQYVLTQSAQRWPMEVIKDVPVKLYTYSDDETVSVLSVNVPLASADFSGLTRAFHIGVSGTGVPFDKLALPRGGSLTEFSAGSCGLTELPYREELRNVALLSIGDNGLTGLDLTPYTRLTNLYAPGNRLTSVTLANPALWEASLMSNCLESLDLSGAPAMEQLWLSHNSLSSLDVSGLSRLRVLTVDNNAFDFTTLPPVNTSYFMYNYSDQRALEVTVKDGAVVDLSSQAMVGKNATEYTWYIDSPYFDENGTLLGEDLYENEEYLLSGGVTTFLKPFDHIMCVMTNPAFPNLYLYTDFIDVTGTDAGIGEVEADGPDAAPEYYNLQGVRVTNPAGGIYIRRRGDKVDKVLVK